MHYCWAPYQFAENATTVNLVALCGLRVWRCCFGQWHRIEYSNSHNCYVLHTLPFSFLIWNHIEATMSITCVLIIPENGFYFRHLTRFLIETETWVFLEDIPWATYYENVVFSALFDKMWPSYFTLWKGDVINDVMGAWHITCTTIRLLLYTCKRISSSYSTRQDKHHDKQTHKHTGWRHHFPITADKNDECGQPWSNLKPYPKVFLKCL